MPLEILNHTCSLDRKPSSWDNMLRNVSKKKLWLINLISISQVNPSTHKYFRSYATFNAERKRHFKILGTNWIIHPFSRFQLYRSIVMLIISITTLFVYPVDIGLFTSDSSINIILLICDFFLMLNIMLNFTTGVCEKSSLDICLERNIIARKYVTGSFIFDFVASFPYNSVLVPFEYYFDALKFIVLLKLCCIKYLCCSLDVIFKVMMTSSYVNSMVKYFMEFLVIIHWTTCMFHIIHILNQYNGYTYTVMETSLFENYHLNFFKVLTSFFGIDYANDRNVASGSEKILLTITNLMGHVFLIYVFVSLFQYFQMNNNKESTELNTLDGVQRYMAHRRCSSTLKNRINTYYNFRMQKYVFKSGVYNTLTDKIENDIHYYYCRNILQTVTLFSDVMEVVLKASINYLREEIYLPNDLLFSFGMEGNSLYIIYSGTVAVISSHGKEICHLQDGAFLGEIELILEDQKTLATVVALETCVVHVLKRKIFLACFKDNIAAYKKLIRSCLFKIGYEAAELERARAKLLSMYAALPD